MIKENQNEKTDCYSSHISKHNQHCNHHNYHGNSNAIYGLGIIGALFYFLPQAANFGMVMIGIGKSIFWPAILMFKLLTYLQM